MNKGIISINKGIFLGVVGFVFLFAFKTASAAVLSPGTVFGCGQIVSIGTYTLSSTSTFSVAPGSDCFTIAATGTAAQTVIDGNGMTVTGDINGNAASSSGAGHNFTIKNITVIGTTTSNGLADDGSCGPSGGNGGSIVVSNATATVVVASNGGSTGCVSAGTPGVITISTSTITTLSVNGADGYVAGNAGTTTITNSTITSILANGGTSSGGSSSVSGSGGYVDLINSSASSISANGIKNGQYQGSGGNILASSTNLNLSTTTISATGIVNGTLTLNYTTLNHSNLTLSALANLTLNGPGSLPGNLGAFAGGVLVLPSDVITDASQCYFGLAGTYIFGANIAGDCTVAISGVILNGSGYILAGSVNGNGNNFTLQNITVTGTTTSNGASGKTVER
jgi:hypothetical protein